MKKTSIGRSLGALVTTCAVLLTMTHPASAATHTLAVTGGTMTLVKGGITQVIPLSGTCPAGAIQADIGSSTTGTISVPTTPTTSVSITTQMTSWILTNHIATFTVNTNFTAAPATGTYDHSTGVMTGLTVPMRIVISSVGTTGSCSVGTTQCTWTTNVALTSSNFYSHSTSSTWTMNGTGTPTALGGSCAAPLTQHTGGTVTVTGLTVHVT